MKMFLYLFSDKNLRKLFFRNFFFLSKNFFTYSLLKFLFKKNKKNYHLSDNKYYFNITDENELFSYFYDRKYFIYFGFSYCQRPKDCLEKRFSSNCSKSCSDCLIGKSKTVTSKNTIIITKVSNFATFLFKNLKRNKKTIFIITACPYAIENFSFYAKLLNIKCLAIPLGGNVCNNFKAFIHAEKGKKTKNTLLSKRNSDFLIKLLKIRDNL